MLCSAASASCPALVPRTLAFAPYSLALLFYSFGIVDIVFQLKVFVLDLLSAWEALPSDFFFFFFLS